MSERMNIKHRAFLSQTDRYDDSFVSYYVCDEQDFFDATFKLSDGHTKLDFSAQTTEDLHKLSMIAGALNAFIVTVERHLATKQNDEE